MKNVILTLILAFSATFAMSQNPSVAARLGNRTACTIYVKLMQVDNTCNMTLTTTYVIPPFSVITTAVPPAGSWYDGALVADNAAFDIACYYEKVSVPWALCTPYNTDEVDASCCGPNLISSWTAAGGTPASPFLVVYQ